MGSIGSINIAKNYFSGSSSKINGLMTVKSDIRAIDASMPIEEQTNLALENLSNTLRNSGSCLNKLLSTTIYLRDIKELDAFEQVWREWFKDKKAPKIFIVESPNQTQHLKLEIISTAIF